MISAIEVMTMDINDIRSFFTVAGFLSFLSIWSWAFSDAQKKAFAEAAELPFNDPEELARQRKAMLLRR